ncbi:MAG TPA: hypothetical protein VLA16_16940 [Ideonella sp.]|nr:hypothetical protein [Ideonella sp.]
MAGSIWYMDSVARASYISPMDASTQPRRLTADADPHPWPDGSQYAEYTLGSDGVTDSLRILSAGDGSTLHQLTMPNFSGSELRASPASKTTFLSKAYASSLDDEGEMLVVDAATARVIHSEPALVKVQKFRWLPDGRLLRLNAESGEVALAAVNGSWQAAGRVAVPGGQVVRQIEINPQGTQMALVMKNTAGSAADAWVAQLDGSQLQRVTSDTATNQVYWSPDGQRLLFDYDDSSCVGRTCTGSCQLWYAPADARNLTGLYNTEHPVATRVRKRHTDDSVIPLTSCSSVHGWLP